MWLMHTIASASRHCAAIEMLSIAAYQVCQDQVRERQILESVSRLSQPSSPINATAASDLKKKFLCEIDLTWTGQWPATIVDKTPTGCSDGLAPLIITVTGYVAATKG